MVPADDGSVRLLEIEPVIEGPPPVRVRSALREDQVWHATGCEVRDQVARDLVEDLVRPIRLVEICCGRAQEGVAEGEREQDIRVQHDPEWGRNHRYDYSSSE
jgi:hypothetical protein